MKMKIWMYCSSTILFLLQVVSAQPFEELVPKFNRIKSNAMVRKVETPTLANLDYAAYISNPVRYKPDKFRPKKPKEKIALKDISFSGKVTSVCNTINETPLTEEEKNNPVAWVPLQNHLWKALKTDALTRIGNTINGEKWADPSIYSPYQNVVAAYLHENDGQTEIWVRIEFAPWVKFMKCVTDENDDAFRELYAKLNTSSIEPEMYQSIVSWIQGDYRNDVLTREEVVDWANMLASYWYPTLNTDVMNMEQYPQWPTDETEKAVRKKMKKVVVEDPVMVIRGKPFEKPIYNVYVLGENTIAQTPEKNTVPDTSNAPENKALDTAISENFIENNTRFEKEIKQYGAYGEWVRKNNSFLGSLKTYLKSVPGEQMGFTGKEDWLFFRKSVEYMLGGDLAKQSDEKNPLPHLVDFKKYLEDHNVNMLFVVVPNKEEVYFEKLPTSVAPPKIPYANPYSRKFLKDAQAAGIEVIDLLPHFLEAKQNDNDHSEAVYQHQDTHWTNRGIQIAAKIIADRVKKYAWYSEIGDKTNFMVVDTTFLRQGDIVQRIPQELQTNYPAVELEAQQVRDTENNLYKAGKTAPIMLIGDSFTGVYELVDCKSAGIGAHIAEKASVPVEIITSWGGGPLVRRKAMRAREKDLPYKRLVIYLMVARDLYDYSQSWQPFPEK